MRRNMYTYVNIYIYLYIINYFHNYTFNGYYILMHAIILYIMKITGNEKILILCNYL